MSSLAVAAFSVGQYLTVSLADLAGLKVGLAGNYAFRPLPVQIVFYTHVLFGGAALLLGPWQFSARLRRQRPGVHRVIGRLYLAAVGVAGLAGLALAPLNEARFNGFFGFATLAVFWLYSAGKAYRSAANRDVKAHQAWAIRNFALTYAAVTLRLWLVALVAVQLPFVGGSFTPEAFAQVFANAYGAVPFLCWLPNIVIAEWILRRRGLPGI